MIHLTTFDGTSFELTAENERELKRILCMYYLPDEVFKIEETGEKIRLGDLFDYPDKNHVKV